MNNPPAPHKAQVGVPNVFITDGRGDGRYQAVLPNPFPAAGTPGANRIVNVVVLWMSYQMNRGGAIGWFGLGGDIHAQLKLRTASFGEFVTHPSTSPGGSLPCPMPTPSSTSTARC